MKGMGAFLVYISLFVPEDITKELYSAKEIFKNIFGP
jgi:hypothetical protein